jgi:CheY-like chemotaxis protein
MMKNEKRTILIADDSSINRMLMQGLLHRYGYATIGVSGGIECIEQVKRHRPDLVLLDIMMPDVTGIEVCKTLQKDMAVASIPVIFVTGATDDATLSQAFEAGGTDYVRKPVNKIELLKRIQSALEHQQLIEKQREEDKLRCVLNMGGTICHELNQPLQYISGMAQMLAMDLERGSKAYNTVVKMQAQIERMSEITNKMKSINTVETRNYLGDTRIIKIGG